MLVDAKTGLDVSVLVLNEVEADSLAETVDRNNEARHWHLLKRTSSKLSDATRRVLTDTSDWDFKIGHGQG